MYCFAIPFNFVLPPGPAGTVARIAGLVFFVGYLVRRPDALRLNAASVAGWLLVIWALISTLWAVNTGTGFEMWQSLAQLFGITLLVASVVAAEPAVVRPALWTYAASATVTALISVYWYLQGVTSDAARAAAFADQDPALFASLLLPAAIFLTDEVQSPVARTSLRAVAALALGACSVALVLSGTRSAWVGILVAMGVWVIVRREPRQMLALAAMACAIAILVAAVPGIGDFLFGRVQTGLATGAGRTDIWAVGIGMLAASPLTGVGFGNFPVAFTPYAIAQVSAASGASGALFAGRGPHNVLLGIAVETGVLGGLLLVVFFASALLPPTRDRTITMVRVALISMFVQALFLDILLQKQLWLLLGIAFGLAASRRLERLGGTQEPPVSRPAVSLARRLT
jgi:O-antigen ligase